VVADRKARHALITRRDCFGPARAGHFVGGRRPRLPHVAGGHTVGCAPGSNLALARSMKRELRLLRSGKSRTLAMTGGGADEDGRNGLAMTDFCKAVQNEAKLGTEKMDPGSSPG